jgi:hypothetical protein
VPERNATSFDRICVYNMLIFSKAKKVIEAKTKAYNPKYNKMGLD